MASTTCTYCGKITHMTEFGRAISRLRGQSTYPIDSPLAVEAPFNCDNCGRLAIAYGVAVGDPNAIDGLARWEWADPPIEWVPKVGVGREYPDVPEHIAPAASEAHACQSISAHRAAVMLARAVIEATAKAKEITTGTLYKKIEKMHEQGLLSELVRDQAHEVRYLGNDMAHGDFVQPVSAEEADEILELMGEVLHAVFEMPAQLLRRKEARLAYESSERT
jgi:Domain of unknown function (DUF4145)